MIYTDNQKPRGPEVLAFHAPLVTQQLCVEMIDIIIRQNDWTREYIFY